MYNSTKYPKVFFSVSQGTYNQKPTDEQVENEMHYHKFGGKYNMKSANLFDLKDFIEKMHVIFPTNTYDGETLIDAMNLLFFDFDNKGAKTISREVLIIKLNTDTGTVLLSCLDFFNSIFTYPCKITNFHLFVNTTEPSPLSGRFYSNLSTAASYPPITLSSPYIISARR